MFKSLIFFICRSSDPTNCRDSSWFGWRDSGLDNGCDGSYVDRVRRGDGHVIYYCIRYISDLHQTFQVQDVVKYE